MPRDDNAARAIETAEAITIETAEAIAREFTPVHDPNIDPPAHEFVVPDQPEVDILYQRQSPLNLSIPSGVTLIGCGGVGVWVALSLALAGVERIDLYDGDTLSTHNLNRYPLPMGFIGEAKSLALAQWLSILRPKGDFQARGEFNPDHHKQHIMEWVVCATDSLASRRMAYEASQGSGYYLEVGADGEGWSLSPNPPEFSTELENQPGYQVTPVHVGPCMMAGAAAAYYILHNTLPTDSHLGRWNGQRLTMKTMSEETYPTVTCQVDGCEHRERLDSGFIRMIAHVRGVHTPTMGLIEARELVDGWWNQGDEDDLPETPETPGEQVHVTEVADLDAIIREAEDV